MELIYWLILILWIVAVRIFKKKSGSTLKLAFGLFIIAATLTVFGLRNLAEPVMRVSFIGWIIGLIQALIEYKKSV